MSYKEYLRSRHWRRLRMKMKREHASCELCALDFEELREGWCVHHWTYKNVPKEKDGDLSVLCNACHEAIHDYMNGLDISTTRMVVRDGRIRFVEIDVDRFVRVAKYRIARSLVSDFA